MIDTPPPPFPRTIAEAVDRLALALSQAEKDEIAAMPETDLIDLHFGLGTRIRNEFGLWRHQNPALLLDCQRVKFKDMANIPDGLLIIHPDEAAMLIIRALWGRLRH
jgi:hypothetical protein